MRSGRRRRRNARTSRPPFRRRSSAPAAAPSPRRCGKSRRISRVPTTPSPCSGTILSDLRQRGIVRGRRGRVGGYQLAVDPETLSIAEVVESLGGPLFPFACLHGGPHPERCRECPGTAACPARSALADACADAYRALRSRVLADLLAEPREFGEVERFPEAEQGRLARRAGRRQPGPPHEHLQFRPDPRAPRARFGPRAPSWLDFGRP
ncbi:MAG TPA: Rrf2 family transcriptional regulator [Polyangiaceae bacterium]